MARYVAAIRLSRTGDPASPSSWRQAARAASLSRLLKHPLAEVWCLSCPTVSLGPQGVILGSIYGNQGDAVAEPAQLNGQVAGSRGNELVHEYWGNFVGLIVGESVVDVVRAPFGTLPVLFARSGDTLFAGSDVSLLRACGCETRAIDWAEMARHLAAGDIRRSGTCIAGVTELRGGSRLTVSADGISMTQLWTPWTAARDARQAAPAERSRQSLTAAVDRCTQAIAGSSRRPLLLLSGGLDSSILAAALTGSGRSFSALTFTTTEPSGDERHYARAVAKALRFKLIEAERRLENVDVTLSDAAGLPRPALRSFLQDSRKIMKAAASECGADIILEGGGGDNVFCSLQSVAPVVDLVLAQGAWRDIWSTARDVAQLNDVTTAAILLRACSRLLRRDALRTPLDTSFMTLAAASAALDATVHPWLERPRDAWPGSAAHIALLVAAQGWAESFDPLAPVPTGCPLLARPVVEACLAIPSWQWFEHGQNRVVAREAYRDRLPALVIDRRSKATPDSFVTRLYERNRHVLREMLLGGVLAANCVVDREALEAVLSISGPPRDHRHRRVMRIADAEAWARAQM